MAIDLFTFLQSVFLGIGAFFLVISIDFCYTFVAEQIATKTWWRTRVKH